LVSFKQDLQILQKGKLEQIKNKTSLPKISGILQKAEKALLFENTGTEYAVDPNI